jgi:catechol 2,3-dioxygenase-like lactoylglutathione lyase family enzyme
MHDALSKLFDDFDRGAISRRQLLHALGVAAVGVALPVRAFGQGRCGGERANLPECDKTPAKLPFDPTGWKTVYMDHFTMQAADYKREAAYYATLMNWKIRSDDGTKIVMDIGDDVGAVIIRGGYQAPAAPPAPLVADTAAGRGGRGGGRGGARAPRNVVWDSFAWGIDHWDAKKVESELRKRGLNPIADNDGKGYESFRVVDPGGFTLSITNGNRGNRRQGAANGKLPAPAPFEPTNWKTVWLDHISFQCPNYKESVAFYQALLGWKPKGDEGSQNECEIGDLGGIIIRGGGPGGRGGGPGAGGASSDSAGGRGGASSDSAGGRGGAAPQRRQASIDHISFGIQPWDADQVKAELDKRGLTGRADTGGGGDIHTAPYKSYHTTTPDGFDLQISNSTRAGRDVR